MKNIEDFFTSQSVNQVIVLGLILGLLFFVLDVGLIGTAVIFLLNNLFNIPTTYSFLNYAYTGLFLIVLQLLTGK